MVKARYRSVLMNTALIVRFAPATTVSPQLLVCEKSPGFAPVIEMPEIASVALGKRCLSSHETILCKGDYSCGPRSQIPAYSSCFETNVFVHYL